MSRKRDRTPLSDDVAPPSTKRQNPDSVRRERKREHDRAAQRAIREKTRNRIAQLEALVQVLQTDNGPDGKIGSLLTQLDHKTAEVKQLRNALDSISKITNTARHPTAREENATPHPKEGSEPAETPVVAPFVDSTCDVALTHMERDPVSPDIAADAANLLASYQTGIVAASTIPLSIISPGLPTERFQSNFNGINDLSISQIASAITGNVKLEGRLWYLAGTILNHVLKLPQKPIFTTIFDEDIAIRAVIEGWSAVMERYPLDRGWQWLKELDETIYFNSGKAERLMHLRNCRLQFLHQMFPDSNWAAKLPAFFTARPSQRYLQHDPLIEHFPWPSFRERLLFFPSKYATNKFMDTLRSNLHFVWSHSPHELYNQDPYSEVYSYSDAFLNHMSDIRCYSVKPTLFDHFPELREDIPCNEASPFQSLLTYEPLHTVTTIHTSDEYFDLKEDDTTTSAEMIESHNS